MGPTPALPVNYLATEKVYADVVNISQLLQYKFQKRYVVLVYHSTQPSSILRPAVTRYKRCRLPSLNISKGGIDDGAQKAVGVRLSSNNIQRPATEICPSCPPCSPELHTNLNGGTVIQCPQSVFLHGGKACSTKVDGAENRQRNSRDNMGKLAMVRVVRDDLETRVVLESDGRHSTVKCDSTWATGQDIFGHAVCDLVGPAAMQFGTDYSLVTSSAFCGVELTRYRTTEFEAGGVRAASRRRRPPKRSRKERDRTNPWICQRFRTSSQHQLGVVCWVGRDLGSVYI